jgi:hypothetical protein
MSSISVKIHAIYKKCDQIQDKNLKAMEKYGAYLNELESNFKDASQVYEKLIYTIGDRKKKKSMPKDKLKNAGVVVITGIYQERGKIINVNDEAVRIFGFTQRELVNTPIENYMPEFYALKHRLYIKNFYKTGLSTKMGKKSIVYILNKENFLSSCHLHLKMLSSLENGISIIGIMTE